jgi:glycosyltransferase involved in cell wall biosynthesis
VHAHEARSVYAGWLLSRLRGVPYLLTRRVDTPFKPSMLRRLAYRGAAQVVCLSDAIVQRIREQYPDIQPSVVPSAHAALANGSNNSASVRQRFPGKTVIGHIGALVQRHKGQQTIIDAARAVADSDPDLVFLLVGSGEDEVVFRNRANGLANIEFTGQVDNIADYLAAFDVFIFPSLHEGLGSSLLDAMSFGLPLVASKVGGIAEIVDDNVNGILIPPNDAGALVGALRRLCADSGMRQSKRDANLQKAATYGADRMAAAYERIYRSILTPDDAGGNRL